MKAALTTLGREALQIVLPSSCVACDGELPLRRRIGSCCAGCWTALPRLSGARCGRCATPLAVEGLTREAICIECHGTTPPLEWVEAWGRYTGKLERVIHAFKFERHDFLATPLAALVVDVLHERRDLAFDVVAPVPMHPSKERERGYNQADLLARGVASALSIAYERDLLAKVRRSEMQSQLPRNERAANVRGSFELRGASRGRRVLLVDDICTTGETLRACGATLTRAGASGVAAAVLARA